jgi:hypothetical protein
MIRMMMAVDSVQHLNAHPEKSRRLPLIDARLHEPSRRGVAQCMRSDFSVKLGLSNSALEGCLH